MGEVVVSVYEKVLTVLLVEPDDSTRHIIAALLRKCNYKVAAVSDGLKAWETLKNKAHGIDLILTEAELPSVSGFSLLTSIMDHDNCKNIPVIVMSSHDSISMVFECMLKGAADFLIKPVRRNELRNLWQHVWRRNAISRSPQNLTLPQNKVKVAVENNGVNNNSTGFVASTKKNKECSEKTSEAQSTCTSSSLEAESAYMENMQDTSQLKSSSNLSNTEESTKFERESAKHSNEAEEKSVICASEAARCNKTFKWTGLRLAQGYECNETENQDEVLRTDLSRAKPHINTEIHGCNDELAEPSTSREAMDLIATFENFPKSTDENCSSSGGNEAKFDFDTQLELSLRGEFPGSSCKPETEDRQTLNHSNASAFSRYSNSQLLQPLFPTSPITPAKFENSHESQKLSENTNTSHEYGVTTLVLGQSKQVEPKSPNSQLGFFFAADGVTYDHKSTGHGNVSPSKYQPILTPKQVYQKESSPFPTSTSSHSNPESNNFECHHRSDDSTNTSDHNVNDQTKLDCSRHDSPIVCSSAYGSTGSGIDGNDTSVAVEAKNNPESFIDSCQHSYDGLRGTDSHHTSQREEALTKFRLKRKNRCFEKKVRYQSRKRLAEQRPRVKGQFVRQSAQ